MTQSTNKQTVTPEEAQQLIEQLVRFALNNGMIDPLDEPFSRNALLDLFGFREPYEGEAAGDLPESPVPLLEGLLDYGFAIGLIPDNTLTYRDLLDAKIMGMLMARPAETASAFYRVADTQGIDKATERFYKLNIDSNYIRMDRISKNQYWRQPTEYGELEITVNLSKPEKDPKEIALLKTLPPSRYPKCLLCVDNVGYAGRADHPARQNLRVIPLKLQGEQWFFQYSPYVYYNEHSIVFKGEHVPMQISGTTFARLLDFVDAFPHYFIGSNADLPIVGGSILNHDHFQAGKHVFPMEVAPAFALYKDEQEPGLTFSLVSWPLSVIRVQGADKERVLAAGERILAAWRGYSDPEAEIAAATEQPDGSSVPHNTITPIARKKPDGLYELDLVLRNNRTSEEHPDGIFHPHSHLHHIKKENIGLIEVMGLAVLPGRLKSEMEQIAAYLTGERAYQPAELEDTAHPLHQHAAWINAMTAKYGTKVAAEEAEQLIKSEVGKKFAEVLADAGVFKQTDSGREAFARFVGSLGYVLK
ncbi:UDP-glucose--hexose-1-phosphate uridylyltransferase [Paenibacillus tarimensis]|uniref:UDP-glucose--hexose-1-phosphate uridylyltransferase n=1 Tax=Paenibacillus tarimensis TaxID=416012 RepID=UPI001F26B98B|nr:UDP-glucose--hexose-1-phosphate uridylyltransferase [Paenibacillus tarimensis]MCF2943648.1 UDP-glucose--hexose-1-phosphate uridylyltransferase [Paenibacillus tarimensis]